MKRGLLVIGYILMLLAIGVFIWSNTEPGTATVTGNAIYYQFGEFVDSLFGLNDQDPGIGIFGFGEETEPTIEEPPLIEEKPLDEGDGETIKDEGLGGQGTGGGIAFGGATCANASRNSITWTFDKAYECGQFANGDWWVVGPIKITSFNPSGASTTYGDQGSEINPSRKNNRWGNGFVHAENNVGVKSAYNATLDVADGVNSSNPLTVPIGSSIVSTRTATKSGARPAVFEAEVLTVLATTPAVGSFRPPAVGTDKQIRFSTNNLQKSKLANLDSKGTVPAISVYENIWDKRVAAVITHMADTPTGQYIGDDYGREYVTDTGKAMLILNTKLRNGETKDTLLAHMVQQGIDLCGSAKDYGRAFWQSNGGFNSGRLQVIIFAWDMLGRPTYFNECIPAIKHGVVGKQNEFEIITEFQDIDQTFYVDQDAVDWTNDKKTTKWNPDTRECKRLNKPNLRYATTDIGLPDWGIRHQKQPWTDDKALCSGYRQCCNGGYWVPQALTAHIMGHKPYWAHNPFFDYVDRYHSITELYRPLQNYEKTMWQTYRKNYGCVYDSLVNGTRKYNGTCSNAICGNGNIEPGEECDDGNTKNGDGCSSTCKKEPKACWQQGGTICDPNELCEGRSVTHNSTGVCCIGTCKDPNDQCTAITENGITWTFNESHECGQYANGDWWVKVEDTRKTVTITSITPNFDGRLHGWQINPNHTKRQALDARVDSWSHSYYPNPYNINYSLKTYSPNTTHPYIARAGESHVKVVSHPKCNSATACPNGNPRPALKSASILTIVNVTESADKLRPPYFGNEKPTYLASNMRLSLLPRYKPTPSARSLSWVETRFAEVWLDHKHHAAGRHIHPTDHMQDYGAEIGSDTAQAALTLMLDYTPTQKRQAAIQYVQYGIDLYAAFKGGLTTTGGSSGIGGHGLGRKLPMLMAGYLFNDQAMMDFIQKAPKSAFQENDDATYSPLANNGKGAVLWGQTGDNPATQERNYWANVLNYNFGGRTYRDPYLLIDGGHRPGEAYQLCCTTAPHKGYILALHLLPALKPIANNSELITYIDRWVTFGTIAQPDKCAPADPRDNLKNYKGSHNGLWQYYGVTYGPDGKGGCILDKDSSDGIGRFPSKHGAQKNKGGYGSAMFEEMWNAYRGNPQTLFYVSVTGGGKHDGSNQANAFNLAEALTHSAANTNKQLTYELAAGSYGTFNDNTARSTWHTFQAATGTKPLFTGIQLDGGTTTRNINLALRGFEIVPGGVYVNAVNYVELDGLDVHGTVTQPFNRANYGNCNRYNSGSGVRGLQGVQHFTLKNSQVHDMKVTAATCKDSYCYIQNNTFYDLGNDAVQLWMDSSGRTHDRTTWIVEDNEFYNVGDCDLWANGSKSPAHPDFISTYFDGTVRYDIDNVIVRRNKIHHGKAQGIALIMNPNWATNVIIEKNVVTDIEGTYQEINVDKINGLQLIHNTVHGTTHVNKNVRNVRLRDHLATDLVYYDSGAGITEWDYYTANGWQDPKNFATGTHYCKGPIEFENAAGGDYRPKHVQSGTFTCGTGYKKPVNPCRMSTTNGALGALNCKPSNTLTCTQQGGTRCNATSICTGTTTQHNGTGICCLTGICKPPVLGENLISHWKFDGNLEDVKGTNPGSCSGTACPTYVTGKGGQGAQFDGINDIVNLSSSASLEGLKQITVTAWVQMHSPADSGGSRFFVKSRTTTGGDDYGFNVRPNAGISFVVNGSNEVKGNTVPKLNTWYFLTGTYDGTTVKMYIDGKLTGSQTHSTTTVGDSKLPVAFGAHPSPQNTRRLHGIVDDVRIFNRSLTETEIGIVMRDINGSGGGSPPNAPSNLGATSISASRIDLSWQDNSNNENGFTIQRDTSQTFTNPVSLNVTANTISASDTFGLLASTTYYYRIRAYNSNGVSTYSNVASATTRNNTNQPPQVNAGADQVITLPNKATLNGTATDDKLPNPPGRLTIQWSKVSGPGNVAFTNPNTVDTDAAFSTEGTYILRLTADDSALQRSDDVIITVTTEGGSPYSKWSNGPSTSETFFPIAVWLQNPANAQKYKDIGINTYIGLYQGPTETQLAGLNSAGMPAIAHQNNVGLTSINKHVLQGWQQQDEPDNAQPDGKGGYGPCIDPSVIQTKYNAIRANDTTRPVYLNFGQGVSFENWNGRGSCKGRLDMYPEYIKGADIISYDIYPVTSPHTQVAGKLEYVARGVERLVNWSNGTKIVWNWIEASRIAHPSAKPTPKQLRAEVWMSIIHGSMGVGYFVHEFAAAGRTFREDGVFRHPELITAINTTNKEILSLAPILNSQTINNVVQVSSSNNTVPLRTMAKTYGSDGFLFAVAMRNATTTGTFSIAGTANGIVHVIGENRQIQLINGTFNDTFTGYDVHLYRVVFGGTTTVCGNGKIEIGETCDDNNTANGDGCYGISAGILRCTVEPGWTCKGEPSRCTKNNKPPILSPIGNKFAIERKTLTFTVQANDPDGDPLTYTTKNLPSGAIFDPATQLFQWTPTTAQIGIYRNVQFSVSDGRGGIASENITIRVVNNNDTDGDGVPNALDRCKGTPPWLHAQVNKWGCPKTNINRGKYNDKRTTNISTIQNLSAATNFAIGTNGAGIIDFGTQKINLLRYNTTGTYHYPIPINENVHIQRNEISINGNNLPEFNRKAQLTFYNTTKTNPIIKRNGKIEKEIIYVSYNTTSTDLVADAPGFSNYTVEQGRCGDNICSITETKTNCPQDCGGTGGNNNNPGGGRGRDPKKDTDKIITINLDDGKQHQANATTGTTYDITINTLVYRVTITKIIDDTITLNFTNISQLLSASLSRLYSVDIDSTGSEDIEFFAGKNGKQYVLTFVKVKETTRDKGETDDKTTDSNKDASKTTNEKESTKNMLATLLLILIGGIILAVTLYWAVKRHVFGKE